MRALYDSGALRTTLGQIGLQIATECGKTITPHKGRGARLIDGKSVPILGHVELPFDVVGVRRYIGAIIVHELDADCLLGADFMRKFNAMLRPREAILSIEDGKERVPLQLSTLNEDGARAIHLDSVGLADADETQRELIQALLDRLIPASDAPLGCTNWAEHNIETICSRSIKQKYYPVNISRFST